MLVSGTSDVKKPQTGEKIAAVKNEMSVSLQGYKENQETYTDVNEVGNLSRLYNDFSGTIRYRFNISLDNPAVMMVIPEAYETVHVSVNGMDCGTKIAPSYVFDLEDAAHKGENTVEIEVISTLNRAQKDMMSMYVPLEPLGILSPVESFTKK